MVDRRVNSSRYQLTCDLSRNKSVTHPVLRSFLCCSTVSSSINALVAVTVEDFIVTHFKNISEKQLKWLNMGLSKFSNSFSTSWKCSQL